MWWGGNGCDLMVCMVLSSICSVVDHLQSKLGLKKLLSIPQQDNGSSNDDARRFERLSPEPKDLEGF